MNNNMQIISYAQNFEDVMLYRALKHIKKGFYIDVGAQEPVLDSVTKLFYEKGWNGINIDPVKEYYDKIVQDRSRDINLNNAVADKNGKIKIHNIIGSGLSTSENKYAKKHVSAGYKEEICEVEAKTLDNICDENHVSEVHFLKIDVEGAEKKVLEGFSFDRVRPWIIVIEATEPNSSKDVSDDWEHIIIKHQYEFVYFDGLNRFYIAKEHKELKIFFDVPPNFFDHFILLDTKQCRDDLLDVEGELCKSTEQLKLTTQQLITMKQQLDVTRQQFQEISIQLNDVYNSREWMVVVEMQKIFKLMFPLSSIRRKSLIKYISVMKKIKTGVYIFLKSNYSRFFVKKKRHINQKAKKIVYVGHSYHNKTRSTIFLQNYLKNFFEVEIVEDHSWDGQKYPDLSFIDDDYIGVVFFQLIPKKDVLNKIKNDNIIFCPMYDASGRLDFNYWDQYRNLKIINFSKTLHEKLKKWGFETMHIQYFPKVQEFTPGKKNELFFWQRLTHISIRTVVKLVGSQDINIHLHKAIDPNQKFRYPTKNDEKKYNITYSEWFDTRTEMQEVIKQKGIYIAPREYEGIGQSFIEAMSMGKAVIGVNNPTMNEYIEHNKTGYLFDLDNLKNIDLRNIEQIQKNAYSYMKKGRIQWEKDRKYIIEFIKRN